MADVNNDFKIKQFHMLVLLLNGLKSPLIKSHIFLHCKCAVCSAEDSSNATQSEVCPASPGLQVSRSPPDCLRL